MKKIFTFFAAVLASVSMMAVVPTGTLNPANVPTDGWAGKATPAYVENGEWICFLPYEIYQSTQSWAACDKSGSTSGTWSEADPIPANTAWSGEVKAATVRDDNGGSNQKGAYYYRVTNVSEVAILAKSGSDGKRTVSLEAFELTDGVPAETAVQSATTETNSNTLVSISGLNTANEYLVVVKQIKGGSKGNSDGNSNYYAVAFKTVASSDPVLSVAPAEVTLAVTAALPEQSASVTFSGKNLAAGTYNLSVPNLAGLTVNPTSVTVGEDGKLNAAVAISYTSAVEVAANSTSISLTIGELTKTVTINYSASLVKEYMSSMNIEQLVLDNGTKYNIKGAFDAAHIEYNNIDVLDTLNDLEDKTNRNYAFLGLKLKKTDAKLAGWLQAGHTIKVRFGNVGANFLVRAAGMDSVCTAANFANTTVESANELSFTAPIDMYLEIICNSTKTLVIKQIMVDANIAPVTLPAPNAYLITIAESEHGSVTANWDNKKYRTPVGALVTLTVTPEEGYVCTSLTWNGTPLHDEVEGQPITFTMPAEAVNVVAAFDTDFPTAIENGEAETKVVKFMENGQLMIRKNGVVYNAQGAVVK